MIKSEERSKEYIVVGRPFYREEPPRFYIGFAKDEEEAESAIWRREYLGNKEILDCKPASEIECNTETAIGYWKRYSGDTDYDISKIYLVPFRF